MRALVAASNCRSSSQRNRPAAAQQQLRCPQRRAAASATAPVPPAPPRGTSPHPPRYMAAAPLPPHRYVPVPSRRSPTISTPPSNPLWPLCPCLDPGSLPQIPAAVALFRAPRGSRGPPCRRSSSARSTISPCRLQGKARWKVFFFFFFASVAFYGSWAPEVQVKWEVDFFFYFDPSSIDGWMRFWLRLSRLLFKTRWFALVPFFPPHHRLPFLSSLFSPPSSTSTTLYLVSLLSLLTSSTLTLSSKKSRT